MTTKQKFNYIKNFGTYGLDGKTYFALPMKYPEKEYQTMNDIFVSSGYFVLEWELAFPLYYVQFNSYKEFDKHFHNWQKFDAKWIDRTYNNLIEFENKVKQLNGGDE